MSVAVQALGDDGELARCLPGFQVRTEQQTMAAAVERALADGGTLLVEAGTGVGKTFGYLVPGLLFGGKLMVSTGTKHLQDQLFHKDLPLILRALGSRCQVTLLKGRANYLCPYRLELAQSEADQRQQAPWGEILAFAKRTQTGDLAECADLPEDGPWRPRITSTGDNCLGSDCPALSRCFVGKARRNAQNADLVVINHHLLLADMSLKETGFGELLPAVDGIILDEAHQLPAIAAVFFDQAVSARQLNELARDSRAEQNRDAADMPDLAELTKRVEQQVAELRLALGPAQGRLAWDTIMAQSSVVTAMEELKDVVTALRVALDAAAERGKGLAACLRRCEILMQRLEGLDVPDESVVQWVETSPRGFVLHRTPLNVAEPFQRHQQRRAAAWIFTSATLAIGDSFVHFTRRLGLSEPTCLRVDSPFDYRNNARLYIPSDMPDPNTPQFTVHVVDQALPLLQANGGRAFLLFTSFRALHEAHRLLQQRTRLPLLVQGSGSRSALLDRFRRAGNAVLLGTSSFWEGVDVRGPALSLVVIDRLPFAAISDPLWQAQHDAIRQRGGNPFAEQQLPQAVIALKQGAGRLIRDTRDRGLLVICDPRLLGRGYGQVFLNSLPPFPIVRDADAALRFIAQGEPFNAAVGH